MELTITSMTPADRLYAYNQSSQLEGQTGCIGHLRGDFGAGKEFYTSWFDHRREYKTDEFKAELDEVVNTLREKNGLLCTRDSMTRFCYQNPEAEFEGNYCAEYGFKVQTPQHTYMLRCNPNYGDYNFYLYAYVSRFLEHHMEKAKQGIRFITPGYKELFRIPDGDHIRIFTGGGETRDRTCRVIDETHFETSGGYSSALYHICEGRTAFGRHSWVAALCICDDWPVCRAAAGRNPCTAMGFGISGYRCAVFDGPAGVAHGT